MLRKSKGDGDKALRVLQRKADTPAQGCLHVAQIQEPTASPALSGKVSPWVWSASFYLCWLPRERKFRAWPGDVSIKPLRAESSGKAGGDDCAGEAQTCNKLLQWRDPPFTVTAASVSSILLQPSGSYLSTVSSWNSSDGRSRSLPGFQGKLQQISCEEPLLPMSSPHHCVSFSQKTQMNFLWSTGWTSEWANKLVRKGHAVSPGSLPCCWICLNRWELRAFSGTKAGGTFNLLYTSK